ncbi:E3 ubiquitin/ISG15 ligase TRIM25 [Xenopus laevis]|uniref:Uncharacterized protein n=2 Tax=Xenopus laevis TaxID=8355 RepID=A0A974CB85_XENLA|nr:E3 ubiquitin/ISG15 ligase TRIM25 [Xenopus laevis]OCT69501.1 hypothetical protein XELAEV_18040812mg [Xenopus laevis]
MATASVRSELSCPVCWEIYTDPVTLPCGHNFCLRCIERTWDWQEGIEEDPSCPECRRKYKKRPELNRNMTLRNVAEKFLPTHPEQECSGIFCTYCDSPVAAAKSCLLCEASLCVTHVRVHSKSPEHVFTKPTAYFEGRKCSVHKKILEFYCTEDGVHICASCCLVGEHRGHKVEPLSEASEKKKEKLRKVLEKLNPKREETERQIQMLQERRNEMPEKAASETERVAALFRDIRGQLEALEERLLSDISREQEKTSHKLHDLIQQLEIKKDKLSRKIHHIEELCNMADPLTVLQEPEFHWAVGADTEGRVEDVIEGADIEGRYRDNINAPAIGDLDVVLISETLLKGLADIVEGVKMRLFQGEMFLRHVSSQLAMIGNTLDTRMDLKCGFVKALFGL